MPMSRKTEKNHQPVKNIFDDKIVKIETLCRANQEVAHKLLKWDHTIYTARTLDQLLEHPIVTEAKKTEIRFVLMPSFELRFAFEGDANDKIPSHIKMTHKNATPSSASVITAGNMRFVRELTTVVDPRSGEKGKEFQLKLKYIDNKSGGFKPGFETLKWALVALLASEIPFSETITIENHLEKPHSVSLIDLKSELSALVEPRREMLIQNNYHQEESIYHYYSETTTSRLALLSAYEDSSPTKFKPSNPSFADEDSSPSKFQRRATKPKRVPFNPNPAADETPIKPRLARAHDAVVRGEVRSRIDFDSFSKPVSFFSGGPDSDLQAAPIPSRAGKKLAAPDFRSQLTSKDEALEENPEHSEEFTF